MSVCGTGFGPRFGFLLIGREIIGRLLHFTRLSPDHTGLGRFTVVFTGAEIPSNDKPLS